MLDLFTITLSLLAVDHLVTGFMGVFMPKRAREFYRVLFGVSMPNDEQYMLLFRPWGALGIFAAIVGILPIIDPQRYIAILYALVMLLSIRIITRFLFQIETARHLNLSARRNYIHITLIAILTAIITLKIIQFS